MIHTSLNLFASFFQNMDPLVVKTFEYSHFQVCDERRQEPEFQISKYSEIDYLKKRSTFTKIKYKMNYIHK